jgi:hypothetical protein
MKNKILFYILTGFTITLMACAPQTPAVPTVDVVSTLAIEMASLMQTQTALAASPTPVPVTDTPVPTETPIPEPTKDPTIDIITIIRNVECRTGPGENYALTSNLLPEERVWLMGIGSVPGWYVIENPYFGSPCWVPEDAVELDPAMDMTVFPTVMAP